MNKNMGLWKSIGRAALSYQQLSIQKIGFIGLGNMGGGMVANLAKTFPGNVMVYDLDEEKVKKAISQGASSVKSIEEMANKCTTIITMLPASKHVAGVMRGQGGLLENAQPGTLFIDSSTIDPMVSRELFKEAQERDMHMLDAPVSGGVNGAANGTLTFMVGGDEATLDRARPVFEAMGKNITHCGESGAGGITKLCNNMALAISMIGTSEALNLGVQLGADPAKLSSVMNTSTARCWSSDTYNPVPGVMQGVPSSNNYSGGFGVALMEKDLGLAMAAANNAKARVPIGSAAAQIYGLMTEHGLGEKDFSVIYQYLSQAGKK